MEDFISVIRKHVEVLKDDNEFGQERLLNINKIKDLSYIMQQHKKMLEQIATRKKILLEDFHKTRRKMSKLKAKSDFDSDKRSIFDMLENELKISLKSLDKTDDVRVATDILFSEDEVYLSSEEELEKLEQNYQAILKTIQKVEEEYYKEKEKKVLVKEAEKNIIKLEL